MVVRSGRGSSNTAPFCRAARRLLGADAHNHVGKSELTFFDVGRGRLSQRLLLLARSCLCG
jgi:hypothetical protein